MRRMIAFPCAGEMLVGTLDEASGATGLLIVSGGNEIRIGAHRGMALLAQEIAAAGHPVFRYDRRGIGDSTGVNGGFESEADDIAAAARAFRKAAPGITRLIAFGNCDAASALMMFHARAGVDALILTNPWTIEAAAGDALPPSAAIRARYAKRLKDPKEWLRLVRGGVNIGKVVKGLVKMVRKSPQLPTGLVARMARGLGGSTVTSTILLAKGDNTAIAFREAWKQRLFDGARHRARVIELDTASHSFARAEDKAWLVARVKEALGSATT